jgi:hypothetical protein
LQLNGVSDGVHRRRGQQGIARLQCRTAQRLKVAFRLALRSGQFTPSVPSSNVGVKLRSGAEAASEN